MGITVSKIVIWEGKPSTPWLQILATTKLSIYCPNLHLSPKWNHSVISHFIIIALLWKSGGYTGFALSFRHSVTLWFCHSITFQMKIFVTLFSRTVRPRTLKLGTHIGISESGCSFLFIPLFLHFSFSPIFKHWNFSSHFSQELWGLDGWNLVHTWTVGSCIVYTGIRLLLLIHPFISSFFFLSIFHHTFLRNCEA